MTTKLNYCILLLYVLCTSCSGQPTKINGVSFVGTAQAIDASSITPVVNVHANWAAVMPFGYIQDLKSPTIRFNLDKQWWGERVEGVKTTITLLRAQQINVMLKPQIWVWHGEFTGNINMKSEADWRVLETSYTSFMLLYAKLAEEMNVPLLCIGTELHTFVQQRPDFWKQLIVKIRNVYSGKLTYAENWDQFENVPFWNQLDYVGIDAYFPLSTRKTPSVAVLEENWKRPKQKLKQLYDQLQIPILFTEYGYRSVPYTAKMPWNSGNSRKVDLIGQTNALEGLFRTFWNEPWFAGGFLWKWFPNHDQVGGPQDNRFTVQRKPAENIVRSFYNQNKK